MIDPTPYDFQRLGQDFKRPTRNGFPLRIVTCLVKYILGLDYANVMRDKK